MMDIDSAKSCIWLRLDLKMYCWTTKDFYVLHLAMNVRCSHFFFQEVSGPYKKIAIIFSCIGYKMFLSDRRYIQFYSFTHPFIHKSRDRNSFRIFIPRAFWRLNLRFCRLKFWGKSIFKKLCHYDWFSVRSLPPLGTSLNNIGWASVNVTLHFGGSI